MAMMKNTVASPSDQVLELSPAWELAEYLLGGTEKMRKAGQRLLPKNPAESDENYKRRISCAVLFPAYQRTVTTLASKPFEQAPVISQDTPPDVEEWLDNVDLQGRCIGSFAADLLEMALGYGLCGILVDFQSGAAPATLAEEKALGRRPYLISIKASQILGWRSKYQNGEWQLTQLRFMEEVEEPDGNWATHCVQQVKVLEPGRWETYRKNDKDEWVLNEDGVTTLDFVPFVPVYGNRVSFMVGKPPLIEVAYLNVAHWQSSSDQQNIVHVARVPILTLSGLTEKFELKLGASSAVLIPEGSELKYVEHTGKAIEAGSQDLKDLEERMRQAGAELLVLANRVTATQIHNENAVGKSLLHEISGNLEDALNKAIAIMMRWAKVVGESEIELFKEYGAVNLSDASAQLVLAMQQGGLIMKETAINEMKRRGVLSTKVDPVEEQAGVELEGPALGAMNDPQQQDPQQQQSDNQGD